MFRAAPQKSQTTFCNHLKISYFHKCGLRFSVRAPEHHVRNPTTHPCGNGGSWNKAGLRSYRCFFTEGRSRLVNFLSFPTNCPQNRVEKARAAGRDARKRSGQGARRESAIASRNWTRQVPVGKEEEGPPPCKRLQGRSEQVNFLSFWESGWAGWIMPFLAASLRRPGTMISLIATLLVLVALYAPVSHAMDVSVPPDPPPPHLVPLELYRERNSQRPQQ